MWRKWIRDIRKSTQGMDGTGRAEYIAEYYWYHILLTFIGIFLLVLLIYHLTSGRRTVSFACIIVNEKPDSRRDAQMAEEIAEILKLDPKTVRVDSDYRVSFPGHTQEGSNASDYEKFFFGWSQGELDAVVMPESLVDYCLSLGGELRTLKEDGSVCLSIADTPLAARIGDDASDPMMIVFPAEGVHEEEVGSFLEFLNKETAT